MGQAKERGKFNRRFLEGNPVCCFCGSKSETVDHFPPRCFFLRRNWPEGYLFPACCVCNQSTRQDEQMLAVLFRITILEERTAIEDEEWKRLFRGVQNNQPNAITEWRNMGPAGLKRFYRSGFGSDGDALRHAGWGAINLGPITWAAITRFLKKLSKALYYKYVGRPCDGAIVWTHLDILTGRSNEEQIEQVFKLVPLLADISRNRVDLARQFSYRYTANSDFGALHAVVRFSEQFVFQLLATSIEIEEQLKKDGINISSAS